MSNHEPKDLQMEQMSVTEILECLKDYGCEDLTEEVDMSTVSVTVEAQGGVGDIWKAKLKKGTDIAIKVRRSFAASDRDTGVKGEVYELYNWSQTHHENIHKLLGVMIFRGRLGMVSQWMENGDLKEYLEENETMDRYQMCLQVVKAVQYLHNEDMVHGDLKACNFLVSAEGVLKLNDFDHMVALEGDTVTFEPGDQIGGTLRWMAPELVVQTPHPRVMSKQSDIYALGMELISGSIPYVFQCRNDLQMYSILGRKTLPTRTDNFDNQEGDIMWRLLMRCWDYNPAARPTVNEVHDTMQSLVNDLPQLRRNNLLPTPAANGQDDIRLDDSQVLELTNLLGQASSYEFSSAANTANEDASGSPPLVPQNERDALLPLSVHCAPDISKVVEELAEISLLGPSIDCLKVIFSEVDQLAVNKKRWELLRGRCVMVMRIIGAQIENREQNTSPELGSAVNTLREALERIVQRVHKYNEMNDMTAFLQLQAMNDEIRAHFTELDSCLNILSYSTDVTRSQWVNEWSAINKEFLPAMEMFQCLVRQDYPDLSSKIDLKAASSLAVTTGFYEDLWKGKLNDDTDVAIKVQRFHIETENYRQSFKRALREVYNWSRVDHKNVHKLLGVVMFEGQLGMVSRWMEHGNLREYIRVREPTDRYQLCVQAAKAVQHLHHINLVHGDLKCHKYLVSSDGVIELTDFDRSMVLEHDLLFPQATNRRGGNLRWMAPELIMGTPNSERRSKQADIYALGMTMLEIVTGDIPYASQRQGGGLVYSKVVQKMLPERTETFRDQKGGRLWELLVQCWDHDPALRPSADQVLGSLEHLCNETP